MGVEDGKWVRGMGSGLEGWEVGKRCRGMGIGSRGLGNVWVEV